MKRWLSYILVSLGCIWLSSCQNDVVMPDGDDGKVEVHLEIAIAGGDGTTSRGFEDDGFDPDTNDQKSMVQDDVFVLVFQNGCLMNQVKGLRLSGSDGNATRELVGTFEQPVSTSNIELVVLANLVQNNLKDITGNTTQSGIQTAIDGWKGKTLTEVYQKLVYQYDASAGNWNIEDRRIPMWGTTGELSFGRGNQQNASCNLHRAVAKLGFRINEGAPAGFALTGITITGAMDKGYCASTATLVSDYFTAPFVPGDANSRTLTYSGLNVTDRYENQIYLPEQEMSSKQLTIRIDYALGQENKSKEITFEEDVIRNHSYIYNITMANNEFDLYYMVTEWESETIDIPAFN